MYPSHATQVMEQVFNDVPECLFFNYSGVNSCGCLFLSECVLEMLRICITCLVWFMLLTLLLVQHFGLCVCVFAF